MLSPRGQTFGLGVGLSLKDLASASAFASNIWPRPGLGLQQKNQQPLKKRSTDQSVCTLLCRLLDITLCWNIVTVRERMRNNLCRFDHRDINSPVCGQSYFLFITLSLASASVLTLGPWTRPRSRPRDFSSFKITDIRT